MNKHSQVSFGVNIDTYDSTHFYKMQVYELAKTRERLALETASTKIPIYHDSPEQLKLLIREVLQKYAVSGNKLREASVSTTNHFFNITKTDFETTPILIAYTYFDDQRIEVMKRLLHNEETSERGLISEINIYLYGDPELLFKVRKDLVEAVISHNRKEPSTFVKWLFQVEHGTGSKVVKIKKNWEIFSEFYPEIQCELPEYYDKFNNSESQILILFGPPGTGKTSFIRDYLCTSFLNAIVTHDLEVLKSDQMYIDFLTDPTYDVLVIEDADELLTANRAENNKIISKLLNVSDGLVKLPSKKLIFTTNLAQASHIDEAITRPGRCFDVVNFNDLTRSQAKIAAEKIGLSEVEVEGLHGDRLSLASLFNLKTCLAGEDPIFANKRSKYTKKIGF